MKHITDLEDLILGRQYWVVSKDFGAPEVLKVRERDNMRYIGNHMWAEPSNNQAMKNFDIFGPLPELVQPNFEALKAESRMKAEMAKAETAVVE